MKNIFLILALFCAINTFGQETVSNNSLKFGTNLAFFGSGDTFGPSIYGEYSYKLNNSFQISPRIMSGYSKYKKNNFRSILSSFSTSVSVGWTPFINKFDNLRIDLGAIYHIETKSATTMYQQDYEDTSFYEWNQFGICSSINIDFIQKENFNIGYRFDVISSITSVLSIDSWQNGVYLNVKL